MIAEYDKNDLVEFVHVLPVSCLNRLKDHEALVQKDGEICLVESKTGHEWTGLDRLLDQADIMAKDALTRKYRVIYRFMDKPESGNCAEKLYDYFLEMAKTRIMKT